MEQYNIENYLANTNPDHHNDISFKDEGQKEVYLFCNDFMKTHNLKQVVDVGCGSAYKLINYLGDFDTIGIETEPCYSYLKKTYPNFKWFQSGEKEKSFQHCAEISNTDVVICCDVIEHIVNPDVLLDYLMTFRAKYYILSTPCRDILCHNAKFVSMYGPSWHGPPCNPCHVREWTMEEFQKYISKSFDIISSHYGKEQIECQYHLLKLK